ncbi:hypothetical protein COCNU_03G001920 [Cocos nucifera]|uniref:Uncharacterized protein n=1 Tax=Cocos nucifera TaxID=13894 RepID=A0A8K0I1Q5_COCNU|nr:hypothetical protein COCNU_03G001920 [Cocos nucifera]
MRSGALLRLAANLGHHIVLFSSLAKAAKLEISDLRKESKAFSPRASNAEAEVKHFKEVLEKTEDARAIAEVAKTAVEMAKVEAKAVQKKAKSAQEKVEAALKKAEAELLAEKQRH